MKYIDADKLIAEIDNRLMAVNLEELRNFGSHRIWAYNDVKDIITSLQHEQPEVDLEKEIARFALNGGTGDNTPTIGETARHFYALGLNARKEE